LPLGAKLRMGLRLKDRIMVGKLYDEDYLRIWYKMCYFMYLSTHTYMYITVSLITAE
jgi:hypothetical protein